MVAVDIGASYFGSSIQSDLFSVKL